MNSIDASTQRILLVDDSPSSLAVMAGVLSRYRLETAGSGEQAIESVLRSPPDLILLDVRLPGMDGYETCRRLKRMDCAADIPIIFFTGLRDAEDEALASPWARWTSSASPYALPSSAPACRFTWN